MGSGDISQLSFDGICTFCRKSSRSKAKYGKGIGDTRINKSTLGGVTRVELGNLVENFKTYILGNCSSQLDTIRTNKKQDEEYTNFPSFAQNVEKGIL